MSVELTGRNDLTPVRGEPLLRAARNLDDKSAAGSVELKREQLDGVPIGTPVVRYGTLETASAQFWNNGLGQLCIDCFSVVTHRGFHGSVTERLCPFTKDLEGHCRSALGRNELPDWAHQRRPVSATVGHKPTFIMAPENYPAVGKFKNDTSAAMTLHLEMVPEMVVLEPGDEVELLARPTENLLPLDIAPVHSGLCIHAHKEFDPDWHVRFKGRVIKAGHPTRLADYR